MNRVVLVLSLSAGLLACRADQNDSANTPPPGSLNQAPPVTSTEATTMNLGNPALPGIEAAAVSAELTAALSRALTARGEDYRPRTHHLRPDGSPIFTNRLIRETSPYLLQHAHNPVNWYPWGEEALGRAQAEDKPIFLSIGYSTCHWCHVMERESFEDAEIAAFINTHFIPIKVDREERPDLDDLYMRAVHMMVRRGGWPMTTMLTPDREPFFAGTYFPPRDGVRGARRGLLSILQEMARRFREERATVVAEAQRISQRLQQAAAPRPPGDVPPDTAIGIAARQLARGYDAQLGGFGRAPKFPQPSRLLMMTRYAHRARDESAMRMVTHTLDQMARGGIYDQVGGGFHRYSTDARWLVPHFEKMLYDNAQLVDAYLEAYQATGERRFADTARHVLDYVTREMTNAGGGFYSATDADSPVGDDPSGHQEEGWFFTWTPAELRAVLGAERSRVVEARYGVSARGNFEGRNILHVVLSEDEVAQRMGMPVAQVRDHLSSSLQALYDARATRPPPLRDDKVLTAWNGLMIHAFARAGLILDDDGYRDTSRRAADYLWNHLRREDGRLMRSQLGDAEPRHLAYLIDYAAYIEGLLSVFEATGQPQMLQRARTLATLLEAHHADEAGGGYYQTADDAEALLTRDKPDADNVIPSGASIAAMNLLRLAAFTGDDVYRATAERLFASVSSAMQRYPSGFPRMLCALDAYYDRFLEVAIVGPSASADAAPLLDVIRRTYSPARVVVQTTDDVAGVLARDLPWLQGKRAQDGRVTAYVCERGRCELPTSDPETLRRQLTARPYEPAPSPISP